MKNYSVKIGSVELSEKEIKQYYETKKYICTSSSIFQIHYSPTSNQYYGHKVIEAKGFAKRGRFFALTAKEINQILGKIILVED